MNFEFSEVFLRDDERLRNWQKNDGNFMLKKRCRRETIKDSPISEEIVENGFYLDRKEEKVKCCMQCTSINVFDIEKKKLQHLKECPYESPSNTRSRVFFSEEKSFFFEKERLDSFIEFPHYNHLTPKILAKHGFISTRISDFIGCVFCNKTFTHLETLNPDDIVNHTCSSEKQSRNGDRDESMRDINRRMNSKMCDFNISFEVSKHLEELRLKSDDHFAIFDECYYFKQSPIRPLSSLDEFKERRETFNSKSWPIMIGGFALIFKLAEAGFCYIGKYYFLFHFLNSLFLSVCYIYFFSLLTTSYFVFFF